MLSVANLEVVYSDVILEKAVEQGDLTRAGVVKAFESLKNLDMGGLLDKISYGSECKDKVSATSSTIWKIDPAQPIAFASVATIDSPAVKQFPYCQ